MKVSSFYIHIRSCFGSSAPGGGRGLRGIDRWFDCLATVSSGLARDTAISFLRVIGLARLLVEVVRVGAFTFVDLLALQLRRGVLDAWRGDGLRLGVTKPQTVNYQVDVPRVGFVFQSTTGYPHYAVQDADPIVSGASDAKATSDFDLERLGKDLLEPVQIVVSTEGSEVIAVNDAGQVAVFHMEDTR